MIQEARRPTLPAWMRDLVAPFRTHAILAVALGVTSAACAVLLMFVSGYLISRTAQPATTLFMVMTPVALVQVFGIGRPIARYFERLISHNWVFRVTSGLRSKLFEALDARACDPGDASTTGNYLQLLADDIGHLQNLYLRVTFPAIIAVALCILAAVFCGLYSPLLGLLLLVLGIIALLLIPLATFLLVRPIQQRSKQMKSHTYAGLTDDIMGAVDWALAGRSLEAAQIHLRESRHSSSSDATIRRTTHAAELVMAIVLGGGVCAIVAISASLFQGNGDIVNYIAAFALGFFPLVEVFAALPDAASNSVAHIQAVERLSVVLSEEHPSTDIETPRNANCIQEAPIGEIAVDDVTYSYPQSSVRAIDRLTLHVPKGQKLAVIGRSGSGKTTLARLLRDTLVPSGGSIAIGGSVGYVPQSPYIFDRTLRENLLIAKPDATDDELIDALRSVGLSKKLATLEKGLDTPIGETGTGFSGGEAHRLSLARVALARFPIVLLDEPFSAVDPLTEQCLLDTLFTAFENVTLVVITHHLADIERFERVVFIEDGRIVKDGSPRNLARSDPQFQALLSFDRGSTSPQPLEP